MNEEEAKNGLPTDNKKPTYIHEQHNYNCQQFFGPITGCTFTMPTPSETSGNGTTSKSATPRRAQSSQPQLSESTYRYRWIDQHTERIILLYQFLLRAKMIDQGTQPETFEAIFLGDATTARIKWNCSQAWLWYLLKQLVEKKYILLEEGQSIWIVASSHFVDKTGRLYSHQSFSKCKPPKKAITALDRLVEILNPSATPPNLDIMDDDPGAELWSGIKDRGWDINR